METFNELNNIQYSIYYLTPKMALNAKSQSTPRKGALLRIEFKHLGIGYANCHPWPELGDYPLEEQLSLLSKNILTPLTKKCIYFARIDAEYRAKNESAFSNKGILKNHLIASYENLSGNEILKIKSLGFEFLKLKFGKNLNTEIEFIKKNYFLLKENKIKLRLDFNSVLNKKESLNFFEEIKNKLDIIDFVEDPCDFLFEDWKEIQENYNVNLALDRKLGSENSLIAEGRLDAFRVLVLKPAIEDMSHYLRSIPTHRVVFTSYMDHALGQLSAIYEAQNFYYNYPEKREHCGFLTHQLYDNNGYFDQFKIENAILSMNLEAGFGFGKLLEKENWINITK